MENRKKIKRNLVSQVIKAIKNRHTRITRSFDARMVTTGPKTVLDGAPPSNLVRLAQSLCMCGSEFVLNRND